MNYGLELNSILDKCNLTREERETFEKFLDGKVYIDKSLYPDREKSLSEMIKLNPILDTAQIKIHQCGLWGKLIKLVVPLNCNQKLKIKHK